MLTNLIRAGIAASALLIAPIAAQSADMPRSYKAPAYTAPSYANWSGFYVGINGGYGFGKSHWTGAGLVNTGDFDVKGGMAGLTAGYNFQTGSWVWGIEGDVDYSAMKGTGTDPACGAAGCTTKNTYLATLRGRLGYAGWNNLMPYITGGAAYGGIKVEDTFGSATGNKFGYALGGGLEYAILGNWSVKAEYLYVDLGSLNCGAGSCSAATSFDVSFKSHIARAGLNYRF